MAIIKCPECGHDVSDKAPVCLYCGVEIAGKYIARPAGAHQPGPSYTPPTSTPTQPQSRATNPTAATQTTEQTQTRLSDANSSRSSVIGQPIGNGAYGDPERKKKPKMGHFLIYLILVLILLIIAVVAYNFLADNKNEVQTEEQEYEYVMNSTDVARMKRYLETFNDAPRSHRDDVQARLSQINQAQRDWDDVLNSNNINAFKRYIEENPDSPYTPTAIHKVDSIDWAHARMEDNTSAYEAYLRDHPNGEHTTEARRHATDTKTEEELQDPQETQEEQPQPVSIEVTESEKRLADETITKFFVSINMQIPSNMERLVRPTMDSFLGEKNATTENVTAFIDKLWTDAKNLNWRIDHNALTAEKNQDGEYTVKFPATLSKRTQDNKDSQKSFNVVAKIDPNGKIFYLSMTNA